MIPPEKEQEWRDMYGGTQAERKKKEEETAKKAAKKTADKARKEEKKKQQNAPPPTLTGGVDAMAQRSVEATAIQGAADVDVSTEAVDGVADGCARSAHRSHDFYADARCTTLGCTKSRYPRHKGTDGAPGHINDGSRSDGGWGHMSHP